jgi:hypothetical protein
LSHEIASDDEIKIIRTGKTNISVLINPKIENNMRLG